MYWFLFPFVVICLGNLAMILLMEGDGMMSNTELAVAILIAVLGGISGIIGAIISNHKKIGEAKESVNDNIMSAKEQLYSKMNDHFQNLHDGQKDESAQLSAQTDMQKKLLEQNEKIADYVNTHAKAENQAQSESVNLNQIIAQIEVLAEKLDDAKTEIQRLNDYTLRLEKENQRLSQENQQLLEKALNQSEIRMSREL